MKTILFIEDETGLQKTVSQALKKEHFNILTALDGKNGLNLAKKHKPDLILLDLILPKLDGFAVLEELKKNQSTKDIPVVVLTNLENPPDIEKAIELGATTYLVKANYTLPEIIEKIKEVIK